MSNAKRHPVPRSSLLGPATLWLGFILPFVVAGLAGGMSTAAADGRPQDLPGTPTEISSVTNTPTPTLTSMGIPTSTSSPTDGVTPEPTRNPLPIDTETLPAPTVSETPSVTDTPTPTPTSTEAPTSTPSPTGGVTPASIDSESEYVPDEVLVKLRPGYTLETVAASLWPNVVEFEDGDDALKTLSIWVLRVPPGQVPPVVAALQGSPAVEFAEPNYIAQAYFIPNDPGLVQQTYLWNIQMAQAWDVTLGTPSVVVAVIDTGVDVAHPDLAAKIWHNLGELGTDAAGNDKRTNGLDDDGDGYVDDWQGWNVVGNSGNVQDDHGHGTHVAGIIAADTNNGQGIAGVAPGALIMPLKALDSTGFGTYAQVAEAILYTADHGAQVINLSLGSPSPSGLLKAAIDYASTHGSIVVAAVGDSGSLGVNYPANYPTVVGVGATDSNNQLASFSTYGNAVKLVAPGVGIYSTFPGGTYAQFSGSSMAAAHVSGVAALLASLPQFDTPDKIRAALQSSATDLGDPGWDMYYGFGLVQAFTAMNYAPGGMPTPTPIPAPTDTPGPTPTEPGGGLTILAAPQPMPTAPPPAPTNVPGASDPHVYYAATTDSCAACHRAHTANGIVLRHTWPEENVCFTCHTSGGSGTNVQPAFTSYTNTATRYFKHDIGLTNGVHRVGENTGASFGGASRHNECEDCHDPHEATRGSASAPFLQRVMNYISGVNPSWTAAGAPASYTWLPQAEREYQVCFKCHSSFTTLPTYQPDGWNGTAYVANGLPKLTSANPVQVLDSRDLAQEFNPYNASFHPVVAQGRNQSIPSGSWAAGSGMSQTSLIYCSNCHNNPNSGTQGIGPHGSPRLHLLLGGANYSTVFVGPQPSSQELCFRCHDYTAYANNGSAANTNFRDGNQNLHDTHIRSFGGTCYMCHDTHGSEQLHLINFDVSVAVPNTGYNSQSAWAATANGGNCYLNCHNVNHNPKNYTR